MPYTGRIIVNIYDPGLCFKRGFRVEAYMTEYRQPFLQQLKVSLIQEAPLKYRTNLQAGESQYARESVKPRLL